MTVIRPARISRVLEAKKEVLRARLLIRLASAIRCSRNSSRLIQSLRYRCSTLARQAVSLPRRQAYRVYRTQQNMNQQNANRFSQSDSAFRTLLMVMTSEIKRYPTRQNDHDPRPVPERALSTPVPATPIPATRRAMHSARQYPWP